MLIKEYKAPAKINLGLYLMDKRPNGYHELASIFLPLEFHDLVRVELSDADGLDIKTSGPYANVCSDLKKNTIYKAYQTLKSRFNIKGGFKVFLEKNIPAQAGLGGGSSDAAAFMRAINDLLELGLSTTELQTLALNVGADVPFFIRAQAAFVEGIGERIEHFDLKRNYWIIIIKPTAGLNTAAVYSKTTLSLTLKNINVKRKEHLKSLAFQGLKEADELAELSNDLEVPSLGLLPEILEIKHYLKGLSPRASMMSGSGSAVFAIFDKDISSLDVVIPNKNWFFCTTKVMRGSL